MTLSDRLAAAERRRAGAPDDDDEDDAGQASAVPSSVEITIVLPPESPVVAVAPDPDAAEGSVCPTCYRPGELAMIDLHRQTTDWQCNVCGTLWRSRQLNPGSVRSSSLLPPMRG